jgi:hypothetical protein
MIIELAKEYYWESPAHYQRWPELLLKFPDIIKEKSKNEIAIHYGNFLKDKKGRVHFDEFHNLFGAEPSDKGFKIFGSNLIKSSDQGFIKTKEAIELEEAYKKGEDWQLFLLQQVLKYSLRLRSIFAALLDGAVLMFPFGFLKGYNEACLRYKNVDYFIFSPDKNKANLNNLVWSNPTATIGKFWMDELNIPEGEIIVITGINRLDPSLHSISTWLRNPIYLANDLGLLIEETPSNFTLNFPEIKRVLPQSILDSFGNVIKLDEITLLKDLIKVYQEINGYFPVALVGNIMKKTFIPFDNTDPADWIDKYFMTGVKERKFSIIGYQQGQPRHGRGLLGNIEKQLIKLEF